MTIQFDTPTRNARLDSIETVLGASPILEIRSLAPPANTAASNVGVVLASLALPADAFAAASSGSKAKQGTWEVLSAAASGTPGHFRLFSSDGTTCRAQGTVTLTGGGGDMTLDSATITAGQKVTITTFTITDPNG